MYLLMLRFKLDRPWVFRLFICGEIYKIPWHILLKCLTFQKKNITPWVLPDISTNEKSKLFGSVAFER